MHYTQEASVDKVDDSVSLNDTDLGLYTPRDAGETSITVVSHKRFSSYVSDKDENKLREASGDWAENGECTDLKEDNKVGGPENRAIGAVAVDENLFTGDDLGKLEEFNILDLEE